MRIIRFLSELTTQIVVRAGFKPATVKAWQRSSPYADGNGRDWIARITN